jgi:hypothetical protein
MLEIVAACADLESRRIWAKQVHGIDAIAMGDFWLPVVWTVRGPLYAEVIARQPDGRYHQPCHLSDRVKQPLYHFAYSLLTSLSAPPAVYLIQFALQSPSPSTGLAFVRESSHKMQESLPNAKPLRRHTNPSPIHHPLILFDRLIPFPDEPAIASIGVQEPNLFTCHWLCLTHQPILDLKIKG